MKTSELFMDDNGAQREHLNTSQQSLINWKPILAGLVVAFFTYVTLSALGVGVFGASISNTLEDGNSAKTLTGAAGGKSSVNLATTPAVQNIIERAFGGTTLKSEPSAVVQELAVRMLQGNDQAAKNYLAYQTGLSDTEVDQRLVAMNSEFKAAMQTIGANTAEAVANAGWSLFAIMSLGMAAAVFGGFLGSRANFRKPLADELTFGQLSPQPAGI